MAGEIVTKSKRFYCVSIFPDICLTPIGPTMVPIPYMIVGEFSEATGVSPNIRSNGEPVVIHASTVIPRVYGDEAGIGKGIKSKTVGARVQPMEKSWSLSFNGERAVRVGDLVYMNDKNTIGMVFERMPSPLPAPAKDGEPSATLVALGKLVREPGAGLESKAATVPPDHEYIPSSALDLMPGGPLLSTPKSEAIAQARTAHLSPPSSSVGADISPSISGKGGGTSRGIVREADPRAERWEEVARPLLGTAANAPVFAQNLNGLVRTESEAIALAIKYGVQISEDVVIKFVPDEWLLNKVGAKAEYSQLGLASGGNISWEDLMMTEGPHAGKIPVRFGKSLLSSDEAIVGHIGHEMFELNKFEAIGSMPRANFARQIADDPVLFPNNWHAQAWDYSHELMKLMREIK